MTAGHPALWAPAASSVALDVGGRIVPLSRCDDGWWRTDVALRHGDRYGFVVDGSPTRPDPRAAWLPDGVHSPGRWYDHDRFD